MTNIEHILTDITFILAQCFILLLNYNFFEKKSFHPAVLFSLVWFGIVLTHFLFRFTLLKELYPLGIQTYLLFFVGTVCFTLGGIIINFLYPQANKKETDNFQYADIESLEKVSFYTRILFVVLITVGLPFYIKDAYKLFILSQMDNFFAGLRTQINYGDEDFGPTKYLISLSVVLYAVNIYAYLKEETRNNRILVLITFFVTVIYAIFATGRLFFFVILSIYLGMNYLYKKGFSIKKYIWVLIFFVLFFMIYGIFYGKGGNTENTVEENTETSTEALGVYMVSSLSAIDLEMQSHTEGTQYGNNTLRFFIKITQQLNITTVNETGKLNRDFVLVPYPTNVFTFYSSYLGDFGKLYAWLMLIFFGTLHSWFFVKASQTRKIRYGFYYSILLFPLLVSFFSDMYFSIFSTWVQVVFFMELILTCDRILKKYTVA